MSEQDGEGDVPNVVVMNEWEKKERRRGVFERAIDATASARSAGSGDILPVFPGSDRGWREEDLSALDWLAEGFFLKKAVTEIMGPPGGGKSLLAIGLAVAGALGSTWGRFKPVKRLRVVLLEIEDNDEERQRRISAALRQHNEDAFMLEGFLLRLDSPKGGNSVLLNWKMNEAGAFGYEPTPLMRSLENTLRDFGADLLIISPLFRIHNGTEANEPLGALAAMFDELANRLNIAVCLVHHSRKGSGDFAGDQDISRGGGALIAGVRVALTCLPMNETDAQEAGLDPALRHSFVRLDGAKSNYSATGICDWYEKQVFPLVNQHNQTIPVPAMVPWFPPNRYAFDPTILVTVEAQIARGTPDGPYSPRLDDNSRSLVPVLLRLGLQRHQHVSVVEVLRAECGVDIVKFRDSRRRFRDGLRTQNRLPAAQWSDIEESEPETAPAPQIRKTAPQTRKTAPPIRPGAFSWDAE